MGKVNIHPKKGNRLHANEDQKLIILTMVSTYINRLEMLLVT